MGDQARVRRLAGRIQELTATALRKLVKDPRLGMVTITDARLTADLREATVYYTVFGDAEEQKASAAALESAKGMIRTSVGRALGLRHTPSLSFAHDQVPEQVQHIEELLEQARENDARVQAQAASARYAGDANPYRVAEDEEG